MTLIPLERVAKTVFRPCRNLAVKHFVIFGNKRPSDKARMPEYSYYTSPSSKYSTHSKLTYLDIETSDYFVLELAGEGDLKKEQILVSYPHMFRLKAAQRRARDWFYSDEFRDLFIEVDGERMLNSDFEGLKVRAERLVSGKTLTIAPCLIEEDNVYEGVILFFNSYSRSVCMAVEEFDSLCDIVETFNLYEASQSLVNYAEILQRIDSAPVEKVSSARSKSALTKKKNKNSDEGEGKEHGKGQ